MTLIDQVLYDCLIFSDTSLRYIKKTFSSYMRYEYENYILHATCVSRVNALGGSYMALVRLACQL